jgi:chromosome partitioning protein
VIVVVGGVKGGTGKTTIATNLAVLRSAENKKVLLVDADEQKSTSTWVNQREVLGIETKWATIQLAGRNTGAQLAKMKNDYDDIIVDVGGRDTNTLRSTLVVCDIFLIPFKPRSLDVWTLGDIKMIISEMRQVNPNLQSFAFVNQGDFRGNENKDTIEILKNCDEIKCLDIAVGCRRSFATAASDGKGVSELEILDSKALQEIETLYHTVYKKCTTYVHNMY